MSILDDAGLPKSKAGQALYVVAGLLVAGLSLVAIWGCTLLIWAVLG